MPGAYQNPPNAEYRFLTETAGLTDLGCRGRICLLGSDREKFLHGQVTNDVKGLKVGQGCYAALVSAKGKVESDLFVYNLDEELLLDFEPGLTPKIIERLERYIVADDVQVLDVAPHYGLLSIQGPKALEALERSRLTSEAPAVPLAFIALKGSHFGDVYVMNQARLRLPGFDLFVPAEHLIEAAGELAEAVRQIGGGLVGWDALETVRVEAGIPRFGADVEETNLAPEAFGEDAISYRKGCYIGQEVIARIRTYGQVTKALRVLRLDVTDAPVRGTKLYKDGKEVGYITSAVRSPKFGSVVALGYVRKECHSAGTVLRAGRPEGPGATVSMPA